MIRTEFVDGAFFEDGDRLAIYGYGGKGLELYHEIRQCAHDIDVVCFVDTYKESVDEVIPVYKFSSLPLSFFHHLKVVVASHLWKEIITCLADFPELDVFIYDPNKFSDYYYYNLTQEAVKKAQNFILRPYASIEDSADREKVVLHAAPEFSLLGLPGTVQELHVNHLSADSLRADLRNLRDELVVLRPNTDADILFFSSVLNNLREGMHVAMLPPVQKSVKAFILEEEKVAYIAVPKCATSSILALLEQYFDGNSFLHDALNANSNIRIIDINAFDFSDYFTFCFVRNPISRVVSLYNGHVRSGSNYMLDSLRNYYEKENIDFADLVDFIVECPETVADPHFRSQCDFIERSDGSLCVDFIGKLENFQEDWNVIQEKLRITGSMERKNASGWMQTFIDTYCTESLEKRIRRRYERDFEILGYA